MQLVQNPPKPEEVADPSIWWRFETCEYASWDSEREYVTGRYYVGVWKRFYIIRETPKGVLLSTFRGGQRGQFVLGRATAQMAVPTPELALADECARRRRHVQASLARHQAAVRQLVFAEGIKL